ncbi:hypothetical protein [Nodularia sp. LEGE 04288]|uniref:hypothetical protein n=1 Tax=Nodularia sp. LEGE 04288 TaxID=1828639 RepID=UPI001D0FFCE3|nr:hypothetical protein [Nodularia sp. LEGE 04288]MCC2695220.1 hypothetical protein [Nodularia sp. LEGE 04288]
MLPISTAFEDCCERWLQRIKEKPTKKQQVICDEFTNLKSLCGDTAIAFFKMSLKELSDFCELDLFQELGDSGVSGADGCGWSSVTLWKTMFFHKYDTPFKSAWSRLRVPYNRIDH